MDEWLYEDGIGEARALQLVNGAVAAIRIERQGWPRAGTVIGTARLRKKLGHRALVDIGHDREALLSPIPPGATEGADLTVEITREAMRERGRPKLPLARPSAAPASAGQDLRARIGEEGAVRDLRADGAESLGDHGWDDLLEQARQGLIPFDGGSLRIEHTAAFTCIDVDGDLPPRALALAAAPEVARAIALFDLQGNIVVDFPTLADKADRAALAALFDDRCGFACERTAVNGFGLLQIVRRRVRASVSETLQGHAPASTAIALLRRGERSGGRGQLTLRAHPAVITWLERHFPLVEELARRVGRPVVMDREPDFPVHGAETINEVEA